jgi:hypothetical protein
MMLKIKKGFFFLAICFVYGACSSAFHVKQRLLECPKIPVALVDKDSLELLFGGNKTFQPKIKSAALVALSRYPELKNVRIEFLFRTITTTMATRPKINLKAFTKHRTYQIFLNNNEGKYKALDIDSLSESIKIGWIAHELGHIVDYESRNTLSLIVMGVYYVTVPSFKKNIEQSVDIITIRHGLGDEHCEGVAYLLYGSKASDSYKKSNVKYYLPIEKINAEMCKCKF